MAQFPSTTSASSVWSLTDEYRAVAGGNWPQPTISADYLVVAGGAAGGKDQYGSRGAGGGGAGGMLTGTLDLSRGVSYTVTVGSGGAATSTYGGNGNNSVFSSITSTGGGGGGYCDSGGSGFNGQMEAPEAEVLTLTTLVGQELLVKATTAVVL